MYKSTLASTTREAATRLRGGGCRERKSVDGIILVRITGNKDPGQGFVGWRGALIAHDPVTIRLGRSGSSRRLDRFVSLGRWGRLRRRMKDVLQTLVEKCWRDGDRDVWEECEPFFLRVNGSRCQWERVVAAARGHLRSCSGRKKNRVWWAHLQRSYLALSSCCTLSKELKRLSQCLWTRWQ